MNDLVELAKQFGIMGSCAFAVLFGIMRAAKWFGVEIVKPFLDVFIRKTVDTMEKVQDSQSKIEQAQAQQAVAMNRMCDTSTQTTVVLKEIHDSLQRLSKERRVRRNAGSAPAKEK